MHDISAAYDAYTQSLWSQLDRAAELREDAAERAAAQLTIDELLEAASDAELDALRHDSIAGRGPFAALAERLIDAKTDAILASDRRERERVQYENEHECDVYF